jgi:hypothetical protein
MFNLPMYEKRLHHHMIQKKFGNFIYSNNKVITEMLHRFSINHSKYNNFFRVKRDLNKKLLQDT